MEEKSRIEISNLPIAPVGDEHDDASGEDQQGGRRDPQDGAVVFG
jgi:hypothetical protein